MVDFKLTEITPERNFSNTARLPFTKMVFKHEYLPSAAERSAQIRHTVVMTGLLAPVFGKVIGSQIKNHLRDAMGTLAEQAVGGKQAALAR